MKSVLDKGFRYTPSFDTDIKKRFDRMKREREAALRKQTENQREALEKVVARIERKKTG